MANFLSIILNFYRKFLWISLLLNILFYLFSFSLSLAISLKLMLGILLYWSYTIAGRGKELVFYKNLGWSSRKLFLLTIALDLVLLILTYKILLVLL